MATTKLVLDQRRLRQDGTYPLVLRVSHQRKTIAIPLGFTISLKYWNDGSNRVKQNHPLHKDLESLIYQKELEVKRAVLKLEQKGIPFSAAEIQQFLSTKSLEGINFHQFGLRCIEQMNAAGRVGNALSYQQSIDSMMAFAKKELQFAEINYKFLVEYDTHMRGKGVKTNTISSYLRGVRAIFNRAINEEVTSYEYYPFRKFRLKSEATPSRAISAEKLRKVFNLELKENSRLWHYQNYFKLMFCLIGINFADMSALTKENIVNGRLNYRRKKTKRLYSILLHPIAIEIIQIYSNDGSKYLLPILPNFKQSPVQLKKTSLDKLKQMNKALKNLSKVAEIDESISTYTSRYSWANIAKEIGTPKEVIAEALGHSYGNAVTGIYLDGFDKKVMDKANVDVIQAVLGDGIGKIK